MVNTGFTIAGAGANNADAGDSAWTGPGNVTADDGSDATAFVSSSKTSQYLHATNFGFAIPTGATIDGIQVRVQKNGGNNTVRDHTIQLIVGGTRTGNNNADTGTAWPNPTAADVDYGSISDLWGLTPTDTDINGTDFGVAVRASATSSAVVADVDAIWIAVEYTEAAGGGLFVRLAGMGGGLVGPPGRLAG